MKERIERLFKKPLSGYLETHPMTRLRYFLCQSKVLQGCIEGVFSRSSHRKCERTLCYRPSQHTN